MFFKYRLLMRDALTDSFYRYINERVLRSHAEQVNCRIVEASADLGEKLFVVNRE